MPQNLANPSFWKKKNKQTPNMQTLLKYIKMYPCNHDEPISLHDPTKKKVHLGSQAGLSDCRRLSN